MGKWNYLEMNEIRWLDEFGDKWNKKGKWNYPRVNEIIQQTNETRQENKIWVIN